jgi:hypothetical protein
MKYACAHFSRQPDHYYDGLLDVLNSTARPHRFDKKTSEISR